MHIKVHTLFSLIVVEVTGWLILVLAMMVVLVVFMKRDCYKLVSVLCVSIGNQKSSILYLPGLQNG